MSTLMRRTGIGALILIGLLAGCDAVWAQFVMPRRGAHPFAANPFGMEMGRAALANSMMNANPALGTPFTVSPAFTPFTPFAGNPSAGFGVNPYMPAAPGVALAGM